MEKDSDLKFLNINTVRLANELLAECQESFIVKTWQLRFLTSASSSSLMLPSAAIRHITLTSPYNTIVILALYLWLLFLCLLRCGRLAPKMKGKCYSCC